jgi:uncharacterized protein
LPELAIGRWVLAAVAALMVGTAKTGVPGFGTLAVPLMVLAVGDARLAAGWLLPLLCVADVFAVVFYLRQAYARRLMVLLPWVLAGMALGALALGAPERLLRPTVAVVVLVMIGVRWMRSRGALFSDSRGRNTAPSSPAAEAAAGPAPSRSRLGTAVYGGSAGFATTIANAAGPIMSLYLLGQRLPKDEFVGTGVWFFLIVNLCKVPVYVGHGLITARSLAFDAVLLPALVVGAVLGRVLLRRLSQGSFERVVLALTVVAAGLLFIPR